MASKDYTQYLELGIQAIGLVIPAASAAAPLVMTLIAKINDPTKAPPTDAEWDAVNAIIKANSDELHRIVAGDQAQSSS